jgi:anaerobic ribonucleoside-triphosphate reductase
MMMTEKQTNSEVTQSKAKVKIPCEVYSRIVGYLRPVQNWHQGKQQEFAERKTFRVSEALDREEASPQTCD